MSYATLSEFEYLAPRTVDEAISLASEHETESKLLAGGTDLLVLVNRRKLTPRYVIDISKLREMNFLSYDHKDGLRIGAMCTLRSIEMSRDIRENYPLLVDAVKAMASVQIRNMASIGGNLCNASPAADTAPPLLVLDAQVTIVGHEGERSMPLDGFFLGPGRTVLRPGELLKEIRIPSPPPGTASGFVKIGRTPTDISKVGVAVLLTVGEDQTCQEVRIALGSVAPTPMRAKRAEEALRGKRVTRDSIAETALLASEEAKPITDIRSNAAWRRQVTGHLVKSLLRDSFRRISQDETAV